MKVFSSENQAFPYLQQNPDSNYEKFTAETFDEVKEKLLMVMYEKAYNHNVHNRNNANFNNSNNNNTNNNNYSYDNGSNDNSSSLTISMGNEINSNSTLDSNGDFSHIFNNNHKYSNQNTFEVNNQNTLIEPTSTSYGDLNLAGTDNGIGINKLIDEMIFSKNSISAMENNTDTLNGNARSVGFDTNGIYNSLGTNTHNTTKINSDTNFNINFKANSNSNTNTNANSNNNTTTNIKTKTNINTSINANINNDDKNITDSNFKTNTNTTSNNYGNGINNINTTMNSNVDTNANTNNIYKIYDTINRNNAKTNIHNNVNINANNSNNPKNIFERHADININNNIVNSENESESQHTDNHGLSYNENDFSIAENQNVCRVRNFVRDENTDTCDMDVILFFAISLLYC
eukprot:Awhi_evm1s14242